MRSSVGIILPPSCSSSLPVLDRDRDTPDHHVGRDERLIRLTGVHPFNAEAPLTALYDDGFITSLDLFYVRNHGAVPQVFDDEVWSWELAIEGLVANPFVVTLRDLVKDYEQVTLPLTLVCAGNRRKEQNTVRKSKGFSWGSAGLSTALFTGTLMADVLRKAVPLEGARYVCMEGADELPNGRYGTSIKLNWAMDANKGIMLAHGMNGSPLRPDHGRPLRAVVPGQIGGRSVKWLKKLVVTAGPSENWYHYYDNKVLPATISPEQSTAEPQWWKDERYAIYDLNVNSAIVYPQHNEVLAIHGQDEYRIKGYAYSGGGRRVTKVEISLDSGKSWRLAEVKYPEDKYREANGWLFGGRIDTSTRETCFCWCFWSYTSSVSDLRGGDSILVRATDEAMACQPRDMYWSVLGMMNNPWFRVAIVKGDTALRFEHPTSMSATPGWMDRVKKAGGDLLNGYWGEELKNGNSERDQPQDAQFSMTNDAVTSVWTMEDLKRRSSAKRPLFVINDQVYDGTAYLHTHPGGAQSIISVAASDATEEFMAIHGETAKKMLAKYHVASLDSSGQDLTQPISEDAVSDRKIFLEPLRWSKARLIQKVVVSRDTKMFIFELEHEEQILGLPVGQHILLRLKQSGVTLIRAYTPYSGDSTRGRLELLIKIYVDGKMTTALDALTLGSMVDCKGPVGGFEYVGRGRARIRGLLRDVSSFVMICGGSGVTPILQVFRATNGEKCTILYGNRTEGDILCRKELEEICTKSRSEIVHALTRASEEWAGVRGRISRGLLRERAVPREGCLALICGPPALEKAVREGLLEMGWEEGDMVFF